MFIFTLLSLTMYAQQQKSWKELDDFHEVMSVTFHSSEDDNLNPVREKATELLSQAKAWQKSKVPKGYNSSKIEDFLNRLVGQCEVLQDAVMKKKSDAELKLLIAEAHEIFHEIVKKCHDETEEN